jgi:nucleotide-binding universal stress UspA family protein
MKNFIVPVDFSRESLNGLKLAILFSKHTKVHIQMINVLPKTSDTDKEVADNELTLAEDKFRTIVQEFTPLLGSDSSLGFAVQRGRIYHEVVTQAEMFPDSVIAASTHGASGFQELFIGSNAFRIISATEKPVITLRKNTCPESISCIVLPIDLSVDSRQKVPFTAEVAKLFNAVVHVVGIHTLRGLGNKRKIRSYVSQVAGYIEDKATCETNEVFGDNAAELVINYAKTVKADLISITTDKTSGISLIIGNTAHQILNKAEIPVLCLTPKNLRKSGTFVTTGG